MNELGALRLGYSMDVRVTRVSSDLRGVSSVRSSDLLDLQLLMNVLANILEYLIKFGTMDQY